MSKRMNRDTLEQAVIELANTLGKPYDEWNTIGSLQLSGAYGGYQLQEVVSSGGSIKTLTSGFIPARELYTIVQGMLSGAHMSKGA